MTLDWPLALVIVAALAAVVFALRVTLPYLVGRSTEKTRQAALEEINKKLATIEGHLVSQNVRRMPGRLG